MRLGILACALALAGCGDSDSKKTSGNGAVLNGTNLPTLPQFESACVGTITADFATDPKADEDIFVEERSFAAGSKLLLRSAAKAGKKGDKWDVYWADSGLTGAQSMVVPAASVTVDCTGYSAALATLSTVALFKDKARTQAACTLEGGKIFKGARTAGGGTGYEAPDTYAGTISLQAAGDTGCPVQELHYVVPAITHEIGDTSSTEAFPPVFGILAR